MICPACGKKTLFDRSRCPACGCDPWIKPADAIAAGPVEEQAKAGSGRLVRIYTQRPKLSLVFVLLGTLQILVSAGVYVTGARPTPAQEFSIFDWLWGLGETVLPGLLMLAIGEMLAYLAAIRAALERER